MIRNGLLKEAKEQMLNVLSRVEMSICLLLESDRVRERMRSLVKVDQPCWSQDRKRRGRESNTQPFVLPGEVTQAEWH